MAHGLVTAGVRHTLAIALSGLSVLLSGCEGCLTYQDSYPRFSTSDPEPKLESEGYTVISTGQLYELCQSALGMRSRTDIGNSACGLYIQGFMAGTEAVRQNSPSPKDDSGPKIAGCNWYLGDISKNISGYVTYVQETHSQFEFGAYIPAKTSLFEYFVSPGYFCMKVSETKK